MQQTLGMRYATDGRKTERNGEQNETSSLIARPDCSKPPTYTTGIGPHKSITTENTLAWKP